MKNRKVRDTAPKIIKEMEQVETQTETYEQVAEQVKDLCNNLKAKKDIAYSEFLRLKRKLQNSEIRRTEEKSIDPLDMEELEKAIIHTGDPMDEKRYIALAKAISASAFRDSEFLDGCIKAIQKTAKLMEDKETELQEEVNAARENYNEVVREAEQRVSNAALALQNHRMKITNGIVKPLMEADHYLESDTAHEIGNMTRQSYGCMGPQYSVGEQLNSLIGYIVANSKEIQGETYAHLKNHGGEYIPGVHNISTGTITSTGTRYGGERG